MSDYDNATKELVSKFEKPVGSVVEFNGDLYKVCRVGRGSSCSHCDLVDVCVDEDAWPILCESGKCYKRCSDYDDSATANFDALVSKCSVGDTIEWYGKTYKAIEVTPFDDGCYDCDLCVECAELHPEWEKETTWCNPDVIFKEVDSDSSDSTEQRSDDAPDSLLSVFHDYSKDPFEDLFRFNTGFKFRFGDRMYEAADIKELGVNDFSCGDCCDLVDYCYDEDGCYRSDECPGHRYFKEVREASNNVNDKKDQLNMSKVVYNSVLDFKNVFALPVGSVFRKGNRLVQVVESDNPGDCEDCGPCALSHECTERGDDGYSCPAECWYKDIGCAYTFAPCCGKADGLAANINANEGDADGVTSRSIVADLKMYCNVLTLDATQLDAIINNSRVFCKYCGKTYGTVKQHVASIDTPNNFLDDGDKLVDFFKLTKEEFLKSYSYLTEEEYEATKDAINKKMSK